jgi:ABC-type multidrug transport system ATPase subunit
MDKGKVVAEGSSLSLKTQYGYEQKLVVTIKDDLKSTYSNKDVGKWLLSSIPLSMALPNFQDNITICFPKKVLNFATKLLLKIEQDQILDWHLDSVGLEEVFMGLEEIGSKITKQKIPDFEKFVVNHLVESEEEFEMVEKPEEVKVEVKKDQLMCLKVEEPKETKEVKSVKVLDLTEKVVYYNMSFKMNIIVQLRKFYFLAYASISPILGFATCFYLYCLYCDWTGQEAFLTYYNCLALCLCIPLTSMIGLLLDPRAEGVVDLERYHGATVSNYYIAYAAFSMASSFVFNMFYVGQMITRLVNLPTEEFLDMEVYGISAFGTACMSIFYANVFRDSNAYLFIWILNIMFATIPFSNPLLAIIPQIAVQQMLKNYNDPEFDKILCLVLPLIGGSVLAATGILIDLITSNYFFEHSVFKISQTAEELQKSTDVDEGVKKEAYEVNELENEDDLARLHQLSKVYGTQKSVDKINLSFKENETFAMLGPNGAGKSTLFKLLQGQLKPSSGNFELFSTVSVCNQENVLYEFLTARQQLEYFCQLRGVLQKDVPLWIAKMIDRGLVDDHILNRFPIELSGGMVRRLAIAISMCGDDPFLILDEPSAGLDPRTKSDLWKSIKKYQNEGDRCVLLSTHSTQEAEALSNRIGIMKNGHLIALGTNSELKLRYGNKIQVIKN